MQLSIDMNCELSDLKALEFFWPKIFKGDVMIFNDYGCIGHGPQKKAHDRFADSIVVKVISLPTEQGFTIKT